MHNVQIPEQHREERAVQVSYGHNGQKVYLQFNMMIRELALTHDQVDAMVEALVHTKAELAKQTVGNA